MTTEIKVWQINGDKLDPIDTSMSQEGRKEAEDLEKWIKTNPSILGEDVLLIGEQVRTRSGPLDFLGVDKQGNLLVIELKRDMLPRDALVQAIDYASDIAFWDTDKISEECVKFTQMSLQDFFSKNFEDVDIEELSFNENQRILLVGFSIEEALQRMLEWLSDNFDMGVNAIVLKYAKTKSGDELLSRTMIIPEEIEKEKIKRRKIQIRMSDKPGNHEKHELRELLKNYLRKGWITSQRIRNIVLPLCLKNDVVTRNMIIEQLVKKGDASDEGKAGAMLATISKELGLEHNDYLRQIIHYEKDGWTRVNYQIVGKYRAFVESLLKELDKGETSTD